ncbi:immunoglobulin-binding protein 1 isoform X2 [Hydra vulgaris]|uniref:Immunoglobulin-binding protein 1 isoform X2 n=1 Tax=Hydra vulgaris TaxID=6087 RepID=A0ABM4CWU0_HYDVU
MASSFNEEEAPQKLTELFTIGWKLFQDIENSEEDTLALQSKMEECIKCLVRCTHMVNLLGIFSSNETIDEVSTENVKLFLLPAFLGDLYMKIVTNDRKTAVKSSKVYFQDFLKRCQNYEATKVDIRPYLQTDVEEQVSNQKQTREEKIQRYKENDSIIKNIKLVQSLLEKSPQAVDEDQMRKFYMDWLHLWINKAIENIPMIKSELLILKHMKQIKQGKVEPTPPRKERMPMKPILITRDMIKNSVLGYGYKNLPEMTIEECIEKEIKEGKILLEYNKSNLNRPEKKDSDEEEDEEELGHKRAWDEWKDTHRRGEGNKDRHG